MTKYALILAGTIGVGLFLALAAEQKRRDVQLAELREHVAALAIAAPPLPDGGGRDWMLRDYEDAFAKAKPDPEWTEHATRETAVSLAAALPEGSAVRSFECRGQMCRLETSHTNFERYRQFARKAFGKPPAGLWNAGSASMPLDDGDRSSGGPRIMVSFIAREGMQLPSVRR